MALRLHDTLSRRLREVEPLEPGHVRLYTCGPTVWNRAHIGNFRTFLFEDVLRRWLGRRFARVTHVMNLTDVDDRLIGNANEHGQSLDHLPSVCQVSLSCGGPVDPSPVNGRVYARLSSIASS